MTLITKVTNLLNELESAGANISTQSNSKLVMAYYRSIGLSMDESVSDWLVGIATKRYPHYESVTRAIRQCRTNNPQWRKPKKQKEVEHAKEEIGY